MSVSLNVSGARATWVLAASCLLEALRSRLVLLNLIFCVVLVVASFAGASVALYEQSRLIVDVGLAAASAVGTVTALSATLVFFAQELQNHTAYVTLSRPIPRWSLIAGKFIGLWITLWIGVLVMGLSTAGVAAFFGAALPPGFWAAVFMTGLEMGLVIALALLLVVLCAPSLAAACGAALLLASNTSPDIIAMAERQGNQVVRQGLLGLFYVLPDVSKLSLRPWVANGLAPPEGFVLMGTLYGLAYTGALLGVAMLAFSRRQSL